MPAKKIHYNSILGQQGVILIQQIVGEMGFVFYPSGGVEAGIDGTIEIRDEVTNEVKNCVVGVQSKAVAKDFTAETDVSFTYLCEERDLDYWIGGNVPVILVVSRPCNKEAYWVSVKDYFKDLNVRKSRKVIFNKTMNAFTADSRKELAVLAIPEASGLYLAPKPKVETVYSNLLPVSSFAEHLYIGETDLREADEVWRRFRELGADGAPEWVLKGKQLISFHDLREHPWNQLCDGGTVERFDATEWAFSTDPDAHRDFVRLLNNSLTQKLKPELRRDKTKRYHYFTAPSGLRNRTIAYQGLQNMTKRDVFHVYRSKKDPGRISYCRHSAFRGYFQRLDDAWFLEITPTYHFTSNGHDPYPFYEELLSGIKRLERNNAVLGQLVFWAGYLSNLDLFSEYPFLSFGRLRQFDISVGIDDVAWLKQEEPEDAEALKSTADDPLHLDLWPGSAN